MVLIGILGVIRVYIVGEEQIGRIVLEPVGSFALELGEILDYRIVLGLFDRIGLGLNGISYLLLKM